MKAAIVLMFLSVLAVLGLAEIGYAANESFGEQFLGSPLLALVAVFVIAAVASLYYRIRK